MNENKIYIIGVCTQRAITDYVNEHHDSTIQGHNTANTNVQN